MKNKAQEKTALDFRMNRARLAVANHMYTQAEFKNYLLEFGLNRYEKLILPIETEGEYSASEPVQDIKIIPFPSRGSL